MKNTGKILLIILGVVADVLSIIMTVASHFNMQNVTTPTQSLIILWFCIAFTYYVVVLLYLDEIKFKWGITIPFYLYFFYCIIFKIENKYLFIGFIIILFTIFLIEPTSIGVFIFCCIIFGGRGSFWFDDVIEKSEEIVDENWDEIKNYILDITDRKKLIYVNDIRGINVIYKISPIFNVKLLQLIQASFPDRFSYGFFYSNQHVTTFRVLVAKKFLRENERVIN